MTPIEEFIEDQLKLKEQVRSLKALLESSPEYKRLVEAENKIKQNDESIKILAKLNDVKIDNDKVSIIVQERKYMRRDYNMSLIEKQVWFPAVVKIDDAVIDALLDAKGICHDEYYELNVDKTVKACTLVWK
jgi:hypothetical protein